MTVAHHVIHIGTFNMAASANVVAASLILYLAGTGWTAPTAAESVAWSTAALVAYGTWRASKNDKILKRSEKVIKQVHVLTNSAMGKQLLDKVELFQALSIMAHRIAQSNNNADKAAADAIDVRLESAKLEYNQHQLNQAKVDAMSDKWLE